MFKRAIASHSLIAQLNTMRQNLSIMSHLTRNNSRFTPSFHNLLRANRSFLSANNHCAAWFVGGFGGGRTFRIVLKASFNSHDHIGGSIVLRDTEAGLEERNITGSDPGQGRYINGNNSCHGGELLGFPDLALTDKIVVAVDVDEVLGNFVSALNTFIADRYASKHSVSEYHVYEFFKIWNCSRDEADVRVHEFFKTSYFKTGIHPIPGARNALHKLSRLCKLSVVTSRQNVIKDHTVEWIEKHYPGVFQDIHFGNHFALDGESRPKSEICRSLGAKVLIDDNPRYALECAETGIRVLLFDFENSYPWCKTDFVDHHPLITKVHNWEQVEQQLAWWIIS